MLLYTIIQLSVKPMSSGITLPVLRYVAAHIICPSIKNILKIY